MQMSTKLKCHLKWLELFHHHTRKLPHYSSKFSYPLQGWVTGGERREAEVPYYAQIAHRWNMLWHVSGQTVGENGGAVGSSGILLKDEWNCGPHSVLLIDLNYLSLVLQGLRCRKHFYLRAGVSVLFCHYTTETLAHVGVALEIINVDRQLLYWNHCSTEHRWCIGI